MDFLSYGWSDKHLFRNSPDKPTGKPRRRRHCHDCGGVVMGDDAVQFNNAWYCRECDTRNSEITAASFSNQVRQPKKPRHKKGVAK